LTENAKVAIEELGLEYEIVKVTDTNEIASRGVMMTPALVIDGVVKTIGKVTSVKEIRELLTAGLC
jgi:small redox-active disulfide protein 2